jgi:hypothetical protein
MSTIRAQYVPCNIELPAAPEGELLDLEKINVDFVQASGERIELVYDKDGSQKYCQADNAWYFTGDEGARTGIELCKKTCQETIRAEGGALHVVVGCEQRKPIPR